ncbi:MAG: hypothetical protein LBQ54_00950 [Planctomycetaceae bacterium]|jgi:hypothetical protein|nr:hypothetical protein [Planctomycetaceae bacterium]
MITISKQYGGKRASGRSGPSVEDTYNIIGTFDRDEAYSAFYQYIMNNAGYQAGLPLESVEAEGNEDGGRLFTGTARYSTRTVQRIGIGIPKWSFSSKGGSAKITFGRETLQSVGDNPPDFGSGINYNGEKFEGVDIIVPQWVETAAITYPASHITPQFKRMIRAMSGSMNSSPFRGMAAGECLFIGAEGSPGEKELESPDGGPPQIAAVYDVTFEFHGMPNVTQTIPGLGQIAKNGWDYVWVYTEEFEDEDSKKTIRRASGAYCVRVYGENDFNVLGL